MVSPSNRPGPASLIKPVVRSFGAGMISRTILCVPTSTGTKIHGTQPRGPVVFLEINLQKVPRLAVVVGNKPTFPYIHAARRLAQRFRLENRSVLELLPEMRLIRDAPLRYGCGCGRRRSAARFSKSRFDSPANVLFVIVCFVCPHIARWGSLRSIEIELGSQCGICVADQRRPGAWPEVVFHRVDKRRHGFTSREPLPVVDGNASRSAVKVVPSQQR